MPAERTPHTDDANALATWAEALILRRVRYALSRGPRRPKEDEEDLVQECLLHFWRQRHHYRPERGASLATFLHRITDARLEDLERGRHAHKRGGARPALSLDRPIATDSEDTLGSLQSDGVAMDEVAISNLDLERMLAHLTQRETLLLRQLQEERSLAEISRRLGIPRRTLRDVLKRLRDCFDEERS